MIVANDMALSVQVRGLRVLLVAPPKNELAHPYVVWEYNFVRDYVL
jgi:hypothetical protein